ncbi:MAG: TrkA C-terminal domain-containing protein, partial [Deltaproteobacteria bacterium]
ETSLMDTYFIEKGCAVEGMTLEELDLRRKTEGATILAVVRKGKAHTNPRGDFRLEQGDLLVMLGSHGELAKAMELLKTKCPETKENPKE